MTIRINEFTGVEKENLDTEVEQMKKYYHLVSVIKESTGDFTLIGIEFIDEEIPLWLKIAWQELESDIIEVSGEENSPRILEYHHSITLSADNDETPWCSSFVNFCIEQANVKGTDSARARSWETWGEKLDQPVMGCIAVFTRPEGGAKAGHVGFYVGNEDDNTMLLLGGNQGNKVSIVRRSTDNLLSYRWLSDQSGHGSTSVSTTGIHLGKLSEEFESRGDPSAIGYDSTGGFSYGTYQIASRTGAMLEFLKFLEKTAPTFYNDLNTAGGDTAAKNGSTAFKAKWKELANNSAFIESQYQFIKQKYYDVQAAKLQEDITLDVNARSVALQNVVWSVAVQHGARTTLIEKALAGKTLDALTDKEIINAIYDERSKVNVYFASSTAQVKQSVKNRFVKERNNALAMA